MIGTAAETLAFQTDALPLPPGDALRRMRGERVYAQGEIDGAAGYLRALRVALRPEGQAWLVIAHPFTDFRAADGAQLARLAPHLAPAVETWLTLGRERARARQSAALARDLGAGWLWFDATGRLVECDDHARRLIDTAPPLRLTPAGWLEAAEPLLARRLRGALDMAVTGHKARSLTLHRATGLYLTLLPGLSAPAPGLEPVLHAAIRRAPAAKGMDPEVLATALGLNRSETRLAALLCDGQTLADAAQTLGWTLETARSASKRIFAQTGTRGQSDLMRRMLTGAEWFGQRSGL